jgi:hypothetical protein
MRTALLLLLVVAAVRALYLEAWLGDTLRILRERRGWIGIEVRRRVGMRKIPAHLSEFPAPREERIRVWRLFGVPLWHDEVSVALPERACECFAEVAPQDFDRQFPAWLQVGGRANSESTQW